VGNGDLSRLSCCQGYTPVVEKRRTSSKRSSIRGGSRKRGRVVGIYWSDYANGTFRGVNVYCRKTKQSLRGEGKSLEGRGGRYSTPEGSGISFFREDD